MPTLKTWPSDAVIIICAKPNEFQYDHVQEHRSGTCRDCGVKVIYSVQTFESAEASVYRNGRSVDLLCIACSITYDFKSIDHLQDDRIQDDE